LKPIPILWNRECISVVAASKLLANMIKHGMVYAGPNLFYIDNDDGTCLKGNLHSMGSGSTYVYGILDSHYDFDISIQEAIELGRRAIQHATYRDTYNGSHVSDRSI
jgi:20S proteasome subunit beta 5